MFHDKKLALFALTLVLTDNFNASVLYIFIAVRYGRRRIPENPKIVPLTNSELSKKNLKSKVFEIRPLGEFGFKATLLKNIFVNVKLSAFEFLGILDEILQVFLTL